MQYQYRSGLKLVLLLALTVTAFFSGCSSDESTSDRGPEPELTFLVDSDLEPLIESLPGFEPGESRPIGCIQNPDGQTAEFVMNELWISSDDQNLIDELINDLSAEIIAEMDTDDPELSALPKQILLRFDPSAIDPETLVQTLEELSLDGGGEHVVSSAECLGLFAAASDAALSGVNAGINWVGRSNGLIQRDSNEAPTGPSNYDPNSFNWESHSIDQGHIQNIGVAEAWRGLELAGKTSNKIRLAILDQGFQITGDTPPDYVAISNVPFLDALNEPNFIGCGSSPCYWHGTNVLSAAMAIPDDSFGGAGPAGQVAKPIIVSTSYDFFTSANALIKARTFGARIANMSYGAPVPVVLAWSVFPFDAVTALLAETGMLLFASAGNDGEDVDDESCFIFCVENTWWTPCENSGVICVGGLGFNSKNRAGNSNYGSEHVDIFAPYVLYVGPDPEHPGNLVRTIQGTSFSSPFAAGVAAMVWAADPSLSSDEVLDILYETAHSSPDDTVNRYVNALGAVSAALGNASPAIDIFGNAVITRQLNHQVNLSASVSDFEDGNNCCDLTWVSNVDGNLGTGNSISHTFNTEGTRIITISATDSDGALGQETITLTIENTPPSTTITKPTANEEILATTTYTLKGSAFDTNEPNQDVSCSSLVWVSSNSNDSFPVTGCDVDVVFASTGQRTLTLTATDPQGLSQSQTVSVNVVPPPSNLPPTVSISSPQNGIDIGLFDPISLNGSAVDPEGNNPLSYRWIINFGDGDVVVGNTQSMSWTPEDDIEPNCDSTWDIRITLEATDSLGQVGSDFVDIRAILICK